jgi:hypothetical protein
MIGLHGGWFFVAAGAAWFALAFAVAWVATGWRKVTPWKVAATSALLVILLGAAGVLRIYVPATAEAGEFYFPYLFAEGPFMWMAAEMLSDALERVWQHLMERSALFWIVVVPGICHVLFGSAQWYALASLARRARKWLEVPPPDGEKAGGR